MTAIASRPPGPWRPGSGSTSAATTPPPLSARSTASGTTSAGRDGSTGVAIRRSAAMTWRPAARSRPQRRRASATSASSTAAGSAEPEVGEELARDRHRVLLLAVPVLERPRLDRVGLRRVRLLRPLLEDLVQELAAVLDVDDVRQATDLGVEDRPDQAGIHQARGNPALVAALAGLVAVGEVAGDRREVGTALDLRLQRVHLVLIGLGVHDLDHVPAEVALEWRQDVARLEARLEDRVLELLDEVRRAVDPAELAARAGLALGRRLVALVPGVLV